MARPTNIERGVKGVVEDKCNVLIYGLSPVELDFAKRIMATAGTSLSDELVKFIHHWIGMSDKFLELSSFNKSLYMEIDECYDLKLAIHKARMNLLKDPDEIEDTPSQTDDLK